MTDLFNILVISLCILLQGFFSGSEMVLLASNKLRVRRKSLKGSIGAGLALEMIGNPQWYLTTTTTGTNLFVIINSVVAAVWFGKLFGPYAELLTILVMSPLLLMFGEIIPRTILQQRATEMAPRIAHLLWFASLILSPLTFLIFWISKLVYKQVSKDAIASHALASRKELEFLLEIPAVGSDVKTLERRLIRRVFHLAKSNVEDVMVPLVHVVAIPHTALVEQAVAWVNKTGYSRLPVYRGRIDNLVGVVHAFDLLEAADGKSPIEPLIREIPFIPEFKRADDLLLSLQKTRNSMAIVVDEYGGAVGIVTVEDILEEVVGEIHDEYDRFVKQLIRIERNRYLVNARIEVEIINERLNLGLPEGDYETLGGFLLHYMGRIPRQGETFRYGNATFTIRSASKRAIHQVIIELSEDGEKGQTTEEG